jgi:hypothetical protein
MGKEWFEQNRTKPTSEVLTDIVQMARAQHGRGAEFHAMWFDPNHERHRSEGIKATNKDVALMVADGECWNREQFTQARAEGMQVFWAVVERWLGWEPGSLTADYVPQPRTPSGSRPAPRRL